MSKLANKLRKYFDSTSNDDFEKDWNEVDGIGESGPTVEEYFIRLYESQKAIDPEIAEVVAKEYFNMLNGYADAR